MVPGPVVFMRSRQPRTTVTPKPEAFTESTSIVTPASESAYDSPGVHIAAASFGSEFRSTSMTWAGSRRDGSNEWSTTASPGTP
jgi:hypothetical protein